jgi:V-type H+-transporting ATPase subunit H
VDKVRKEQRKKVVEEGLEEYRGLFLGGAGGEGEKGVLERVARRADVVQYVLVLLGDLLEGMFVLFFDSFASLLLCFFACGRLRERGAGI